MSVHQYVHYVWFLLLSFLNYLRNLFIFCISVDIYPLCLQAGYPVFMSIHDCLLHFGFCFLNELRNLFIFCIDVDIDEMLLLEKNKGLGVTK